MARASLDFPPLGPGGGIGAVGCDAAAPIATGLSSPRGRIGSSVRLAANDARGAVSLKLAVDPAAETATPWSAALTAGSVAAVERANVSVATTSAAVIGWPLDHSRPGARVTV